MMDKISSILREAMERIIEANYRAQSQELMQYINAFPDDDKAGEQLWKDFKAGKLEYLRPEYQSLGDIQRGLTKAGGATSYLEEVEQQMNKDGLDFQATAIKIPQEEYDFGESPDKLIKYLYEKINEAYAKAYIKSFRSKGRQDIQFAPAEDVNEYIRGKMAHTVTLKYLDTI